MIPKLIGLKNHLRDMFVLENTSPNTKLDGCVSAPQHHQHSS